MSETVLCPWCQTEVLMDEETMNEQTCPHCYNEIGEYRSITLSLDKKPKQKVNNTSKQAVQPINNHSDQAANADEMNVNEIEKYFGSIQEDPDLLAYEEAVEDWLNHQDEVPECAQCRESMIFAGEHTILDHQFRPFVPPGFSQPFLQAPFTMNLYVCTACFHTTLALDEQTRMIAMNKLRK